MSPARTRSPCRSRSWIPLLDLLGGFGESVDERLNDLRGAERAGLDIGLAADPGHLLKDAVLVCDDVEPLGHLELEAVAVHRDWDQAELGSGGVSLALRLVLGAGLSCLAGDLRPALRSLLLAVLAPALQLLDRGLEPVEVHLFHHLLQQFEAEGVV